MKINLFHAKRQLRLWLWYWALHLRLFPQHFFFPAKIPLVLISWSYSKTTLAHFHFGPGAIRKLLFFWPVGSALFSALTKGCRGIRRRGKSATLLWTIIIPILLESESPARAITIRSKCVTFHQFCCQRESSYIACSMAIRRGITHSPDLWVVSSAPSFWISSYLST